MNPRIRFLLRLTAPVMAISGLLLALGVGSAWYMHRLQKNASDILAINVVSIRAAEELEIGIREVRSQLNGYLLTGDRSYLEKVPALRKDTDRWLREADRVATTPREQELMAKVKAGYAHFFAEFDRLSEPGSPADLPQKVRSILEQILIEEVLPPAHEYLDFNEEQIERGSAGNQAMTERMVLVLLLMGTCGAAAGLVAGFGIARAISRSLMQLSVPVRDAAGQLNRVVGPVTFSASWGPTELEMVLRKISERIGTVVAQLQASQRDALRSEQLAAVGQLAAGMAHEMRNPLTSMKVLVQAALDRGEGGGLRGRDLVVLEQEITRMEALIQSVLDFARPPQPEKRLVDARALLEQTLALAEGRAVQQGVRLAGEIEAGPLRLEADPGQLRQVVLNLLFNALDATGPGGTIRLRADCARDARLVIEVADTGAGLPGELGEKIFEPFVSTKETGIGLGLSICKRIVEAHGGEITATNRSDGGGAVFTVLLPCAGLSCSPGGRQLDNGSERRQA